MEEKEDFDTEDGDASEARFRWPNLNPDDIPLLEETLRDYTRMQLRVM